MVEVVQVGRDQKADYASILASVRSVAIKAAARASEIDKARKFPSDLYDQLEATGAFRLCAPKRFGGLEMTLAQSNELVYEGARGLGSLGWLMMVSIAQSIGTGLFPEETVKRLSTEKRDVRLRGAIAPKGIAVPVPGGYKISGQWPFATGGPNPDYVSGNCVVMQDDKPRLSASGHPEAILAMMPAAQVEFLDNWHVLGMRGTDSCDVRVKDVFVPEMMTFNLLEPFTCYDTPGSRIPLRVALSFSHCALALGIAHGAIDDICALAKTKRASMNPKALLGDDPLFRHELGRHVVRLTGVKSMLDQITAECWKAGEERRELSPQQILTGRVMSNHITEECVRIVSWAFTVAGSTPVYDGSSLQMRLRDIHVATQHVSCSADPYRLLGAVMLGETLTPRELF